MRNLLSQNNVDILLKAISILKPEFDSLTSKRLIVEKSNDIIEHLGDRQLTTNEFATLNCNIVKQIVTVSTIKDVDESKTEGRRQETLLVSRSLPIPEADVISEWKETPKHAFS